MSTVLATSKILPRPTLLKEGDVALDEAARRELLETAYAGVERLILLVDGLLCMAKLEANMVELRLEPYAIEEVIGTGVGSTVGSVDDVRGCAGPLGVNRLSILRRGLKRKERVGVSTILASYRAAVAFRQDRFQPVALAETERIRALLMCLEPGQAIPVHRPGIDLTLVVLEGDGMMTTGDREDPLSPGTVVVPAGTARGLRATGAPGGLGRRESTADRGRPHRGERRRRAERSARGTVGSRSGTGP